MDHFKLLSQHLPERTDKNHDNPQNSQYIGRYMNQMSLQYKKHCSLHQLTQFCAEQSLLAEVCNIFKVKQREFLYAAFYEDFKILPTVCCCMKYNVSKKNNDGVSGGTVSKHTKRHHTECCTFKFLQSNIFMSTHHNFQQGDTLPHFSKHVMEVLSITFPGRWIGWAG